MQIYYDNDLLQLNNSILVIGAFDGVHLGHQSLINYAKLESVEKSMPLVIYTFNPPPKVYFKKQKQIISLKEKVQRFSMLNVDYVKIVDFNNFYASNSTEEFISEIAELNPHNIYVGKNFRFGANRTGDINTLQKQFNTKCLDLICCDQGEVISSTRIRKLKMRNMEKQAEKLLNIN